MDPNQPNFTPAQRQMLENVGQRLPASVAGDLVPYDEFGIPQIPEQPVHESRGGAGPGSGAPIPQGDPNGGVPPFLTAQAAAQARAQGKRGFMPGPAPDASAGPRGTSGAPGRSPQQQAARGYVHPVVAKLQERFGLRKAKRFSLDVFSGDDGQEPMKFVMTAISDEVNLWCVQQGQDKLREEGLTIGTGWIQVVMSCCSVVSLDGVPIYEALGVEPTPQEWGSLKDDPLYLSARLRKLCGLALAGMLYSDMPQVSDRVYRFYNEVVHKHNTAKTSYDVSQEGQNRYRCPVDDCTTDLVEKPEADLQNPGQDKPFFCKYHGARLIAVASLDEENNYPLG